MKKEEIVNGKFIIMKDRQTGKQLGILKNVEKEENNPSLSVFDIFLPVTGLTKRQVLETSRITAEAVIVSAEEAELFFEKKIRKTARKIRKMKDKNIKRLEIFFTTFKKELLLPS